MLTITSEAAVAIKSLVAATESTEDAGLRIVSAPQSLNGSGPSFAASVAGSPAPDDTVVEEDGAQVFLDRGAADELAGKALHAQVQGGGVTFAILEREDEPG